MRAPRAAAGLTLALALAGALFAPAAQAQFKPPPAPTRWVTDTAGFISEGTRRSLDARLQKYERDTGRQVVVWIGRSTGDVPLEEWAVRTFEAWGIGRKGKDDGLALFVFSEDRKLRIEVGYDLEEQVPDVIANAIIQEQAIPRLRAGDPDGAITATLNAVLARIGGETSPPPRVAPVPRTTQPQQPPSIGSMILFGILAIGFLILLITNPRLALWLLFSMMSGGRGGGGFGGGGGGGGGFRGGGGRSGGGGASGSW